jgi:hypothetical protein
MLTPKQKKLAYLIESPSLWLKGFNLKTKMQTEENEDSVFCPARAVEPAYARHIQVSFVLPSPLSLW